MFNTIASTALLLSSFALLSCTNASKEDDQYGAGYVEVSESSWALENDKPYPFTVENGEIDCGQPHAGIGRQVFFLPEGSTDESYIGTPLNKAASDSLKQDGLKPNVPYSIKEGADLSEAIQIGLRVCDEQKERFDRM